MNDFQELVKIVARLRDPETGCPWDRVQTHKSIRRCLVEEAGELLDAIEDDDTAEMREEIGDVLLQAVFHAQLAKEEGRFCIDDVIDDECRKLVYRHPHVFGENKASNANEAISRWESQKDSDKELQAKRPSVMDGVARNIPGLARAQKALGKAEKAGRPFVEDTALPSHLKSCMERLTADLGADGDMKEAIGALFFALTALCREKGLEAEEVLQEYVREKIAEFRKNG